MIKKGGSNAKSGLDKFKLYYEDIPITPIKREPYKYPVGSVVSNGVRFCLRLIFQWSEDLYKHTFYGALSDRKTMYDLPRTNKTSANNKKR